MNEELIRQCAREVVPFVDEPGTGEQNYRYAAAVMAIETYHARVVAPLVEALEPFALIAEMDIGDDETDADLFRPLTHNYAPHITVGHLRAALKALAPFQPETRDAAD
ncbi:MAG TPA: hypothetical protein VIK69_02195 [Methylophilaceae bacterium]